MTTSERSRRWLPSRLHVGGATVLIFCLASVSAGAQDKAVQRALEQAFLRAGAPSGAQDYETIQRLANQGHADAQVFLGASHAAGIGVTQDDAEAVRWYRRAAEQGHAGGQYQLGLAYFAGRGVPQDRTEGLLRCRRAAEQGFAAAQHFLALTYGVGRGVPQDYVEAARWYRRAAEQGNRDGQLGLGMAYAIGRGVPQDYVTAHTWLNLAAAAGDEEASAWRDRIAAGMTRDQVAEAQARAREWAEKIASRGGRRP